MRDLIARWLIDRAADEDRAVPVWVQRRMRQNAALAEHDRRCRELVGRLRAEADSWTASVRTRTETGPQPVRPKQRRRTVPVAVPVAAMAVLVLFLLLRDRRLEPESSPDTHPKENLVAERRAQAVRVAEFVGAQAAVMQRIWSSTEDLGQRMVRARPESLSAAGWLTDHAENAGRSAGAAINQSVALLSGSVLREQRRLRDTFRPCTQFLRGLLAAEPDSETPDSDE